MSAAIEGPPKSFQDHPISPNPEPCCGNCRFWGCVESYPPPKPEDLWNDEGNHGQWDGSCMRFPPTTRTGDEGSSGCWEQPVVCQTGWCGEYQRRMPVLHPLGAPMHWRQMQACHT